MQVLCGQRLHATAAVFGYFRVSADASQHWKAMFPSGWVLGVTDGTFWSIIWAFWSLQIFHSWCIWLLQTFKKAKLNCNLPTHFCQFNLVQEPKDFVWLEWSKFPNYLHLVSLQNLFSSIQLPSASRTPQCHQALPCRCHLNCHSAPLDRSFPLQRIHYQQNPSFPASGTAAITTQLFRILTTVA